jgi:oleate hydratase
MTNGYQNRQIYFVGGGLASLAGATYLIRDCNFPGKNIHILESMPILGGSNDGAGNKEEGYIIRGGRMLNDETYENTWELLATIPSLDHEGQSVREEIVAFDTAHPTYAKARLINKDGIIQNVRSMGFNNQDRLAMVRLMMTPEKKIDNLRISDWFAPHFFETNFWYMWQTTFAFQKWSSLTEFKRYMIRMIREFPRIETLEGVTRTPYNQYESIILPLKAFLDRYSVDFSLHLTVTDLDFEEGDNITVTAIHYTKNGVSGMIHLHEGDFCIITNGCMTDNTTLGSTQEAPVLNFTPGPSAKLWANIAAKKPGLGNPKPFFGAPELSNWESFTVTCKGNKFLKRIEEYSHNKPGSGALMTFKDSSWLLSIVIAAQPHFKNQPEDTTVFWGYGLYTAKIGDYVRKPMRECTGEEILLELMNQLHIPVVEQKEILAAATVIPCMMPYIDAQFQPRAISDRPPVVPKGSTNLAIISQFVEIASDMVFTEEYSVRAARIAVYTLMGIQKTVVPVHQYHHDIWVLLSALHTLFR